MHTGLGIAALVILLGTGTVHASAPEDRSKYYSDLATCQQTAKEFTGLGMALSMSNAEEKKKQFGFTQIPNENPYLSVYHSDVPVLFQQYETDTIALTATGFMVVLDSPAPEKVAKEFDIPIYPGIPGKYYKHVATTTERVQDITISTTTSLNVASVVALPGKTLAGCSYKVDVN